MTMQVLFIFRLLTLSAICFLFTNSSNADALDKRLSHQQEVYQCMPCGSDCDATTYTEAGKCPHCGMQLVKKSTVNFKTVEPSAICNYIKEHPNAVLLDVRTKDEYEGKANPNFGTLKNAINIPVQELESKLATIADLKNKEVVVFCSHSRRSPRASYILTQNGFTNVTNMNGGMSAVTDKDCKK